MAKTEATIADLYAAGEDARAELVNGELVYRPPMGGIHARIAGRVLFALAHYEQETASGYALMGNVGYVVEVPFPRSFSPDVSYTEGCPPITEAFIDGAPRFAVEIRSPDDHGPKADAVYAEKRAAYFVVGTTVVWDVDPRGQTVASYWREMPDDPRVFAAGETAHAEPALPGWRIAVDALFDVRRGLP